MALQIRRGTDAERQTITPKVGEPIFTTDQKEFYIGDGTTQGGIQISGTLVNEETPQLGANLDLNNNDITGTGNINIDGTITATGNINLGDAADDNVIVGGQIGSSLIPGTTSTHDLGAELSTWRNIYADTIIANTFEGKFDGEVTGSVFADDSSLLVDGIEQKFFGSVRGNIEDTTGTVIYDINTKNITVNTVTMENGGSILGDRLVVGTTDQVTYTQADPSAVTAWITYGQYHDSADAHNIAFTRTRGSLFAPTALQDGDKIIDWALAPYDGSSYLNGGGWSALVGYDGSNYTTKWQIAVRNTSGNSPAILEVEEDGTHTDAIGSINNESVEFLQAPQVPVYADATARDTAITTPATGMICVTGTTFQGYDGTAWQALS